MKGIKNLRDLEPYGIIPLTGEADALSFRCLCDVTEQGRRLLVETFGLKLDCCQENWNHGDPPHVGSVMLPYDAWRWLGIIALIEEGGCHTVITTDKGVVWGFEKGEEFRRAEWDWSDTSKEPFETALAKLRHRDGEWMNWPQSYGKVDRLFSFGDHPRRGTRNVHAMTGRAV